MAMVYLSLVMYSVLLPAMVNSITGALIITCAFITCAGQIPSFSEKMSSLAMESLIMAIPGGLVAGPLQQAGKKVAHVAGGWTKYAVVEGITAAGRKSGDWVSRKLGGK